MIDRQKIDHPVVLSALLLTLAALLTITGFLEPLNWLAYDHIIRRAGTPPPDDIVIVAIDQKSLSELGRWPWRRIHHAQLIEQLKPSNPKAIGLDIIFAEPDRRYPQDDQALAEAIRSSGKVVLPLILEQSAAGLPLRETMPLPILADAAAALGHVDTELGADGIARSAFLKAGLGTPRWPALALAMARIASVQIPDPLPGERAPPSAAANDRVWRRDHHLLVAFSGPPGHIRQVAFVDALSGKVPPEAFRGRYVLVGATAVGLGDQVPTPLSARSRPLSGVEFNAQILHNLLGDIFVTESSKNVQLVGNLAIALLLSLLCWKLNPRIHPLALLIGAVAIGFSSYIGISWFQSWYPPGAALIVLAAGFFMFDWRHLRRLVRKLLLTEVDARTTFHTTADGIIKTSESGVIKDLNQNACKMLGQDGVGETNGRLLTEVAQLKRRANSRPLTVSEIFSGDFFNVGDKVILTNWLQKSIPVRLIHSEIIFPGEREKQNLLVISDLSREERLESEIKRQALLSPDTQLPNRIVIERALDRWLDSTRSNNESFAVIHIYLDQFIRVVQTFGHATANQLLTVIGKRLLELKEHRAKLGHLSAGEFLLLGRAFNGQAAIRAFLGRIQAVVSQPIRIDERELTISASLGVSVFPGDNPKSDLLLRQANIAAYRAQECGSNSIVFFSEGMQIHAARQIELEQIIRSGLAKEGIITWYQPIVNANNGRIVAVEALMRLTDPGGTLLSPTEFIPVAEKTGLIEPLAELQLLHACQHLMLWRQLGLPALRLSVNLSPRQLLGDTLVRIVKSVFESTQFPASKLEFEITENLMLEDSDQVRALLSEIGQLGVVFSLDDFGTGFNSMDYLRRNDFSRLKIDMSFVRDLGTKPNAEAITSSIIHMAHNLGLQVVAEGVESAEQMEVLQRQGCDELQGFLFCKPVDMEGFLEFFETTNGYALTSSGRIDARAESNTTQPSSVGN